MLPLRKSFSAAAALGAALWIGACQKATAPQQESVLHLTLNDSLSRYDKVLVELLDRNTRNVLDTLWNLPLPDPKTGVPPRVLEPQMTSFIVRVRAFLAGNQVALDTWIFYTNGDRSVLHDTVPPLKPRNYLTKLVPSAGNLSPLFNVDSGTYYVTTPEGQGAVTLTPTAANASDIIVFAGDTVLNGKPTKPHVLGTTTDTVNMQVTDVLLGVPYTRTYTFIFRPTLPAELLLASITPSIGFLNPHFRPDTRTYTLDIPANVDTVSFILQPGDASTMTLSFRGQSVFPGQPTPKITLANQFATDVASFEVHRGGDSTYYQVTVEHAQQ